MCAKSIFSMRENTVFHRWIKATIQKQYEKHCRNKRYERKRTNRDRAMNDETNKVKNPTQEKWSEKSYFGFSAEIKSDWRSLVLVPEEIVV